MSRPTTIAITRLLLATIVGTQSGCAAVSYYRSRPVTSEVVAQSPRSAATVRLQGADISIEAQNRAENAYILLVLPIPLSGTNPAYGDLPIWVEITPHEGFVRFDPGKVTVVSARGDTLHPLHWWGPGAAQTDVEECLCGKPADGAVTDLEKPYFKRNFEYQSGGKDDCPITGPVPFSRPTCFVIYFDGRKAGYKFTLEPGTIESDERRVDVPPIAFVKGRGTSVVWVALPIVWI